MQMQNNSNSYSFILEKQLHLFQTYFFTANSKHAPSVTYQRLFLRHILKLCEDNGSEISDELYEAYGDVFGKVEDLNAKCFKIYIVVRFIDCFYLFRLS